MAQHTPAASSGAAVAYLRRSSNPRDADTEVSFDSQRAAIAGLAASRGEPIVTEYGDHGRSGSTTRKRSGFLSMVEAVKGGGVSTIYAYGLTRLTRSLPDLVDLTRLCDAHGVVIRTAQDGIDTSNGSGRLFLNVIGSVAQAERDWAVERNRSAITARKARGDIVGSAPFGSRLRAGKVVDDPTEDLAAVTAAYRETRNFSAAARLLNVRKVKPRFGETWSGKVVSEVIRRALPDEAPAKTKAGPRATKAFALRGLVYCPCGGLLTPRATVSKGKWYTGYVCGHGRFDPTHEGSPFVSERTLLPLLKAETARLRVPFTSVEVGAGEDRTDERTALIERLAREKDLYRMGDQTRDEFINRRDAIQRDIDRLDSAVERHEVPQEVDWSSEPGPLNAVLSALFERVDLRPDRTSITATWRVPEWRA